jgi:hypothetical protein
MSAMRSSAGSMPADSRISVSGAVSPCQRARRSQFDSTPPKLVAGTTTRAPATTASASAAVPRTSNDSSGPNPAGIWRRATSSVAALSAG